MVKQADVMVFNGSGEPLLQKRVEIPSLCKGEVLVKNLYTTLCGSDIHTYCGIRKENTPTILGHEIVGQIQKLYNDDIQSDCFGSPLSVGDTITWSIYASDPEHGMAAIGMPQKATPIYKYGHRMLTSTDSLNGGLSTYCILREHTAVIKINPLIPIRIAATLNCAMATVSGAVRLAGDLTNMSVFISGLGLLGMSCISMCKEAGARRIVASDLSEERLKLAKLFGADDCFTDITKVFPQEKFDVSFDMSGAKEAMEMGLEVLDIGGTAIWVGCVFPQRKVEIDAESIVRRLITIKGLHNYNTEDFKSAYSFIENNWEKYPFNRVVASEFTLQDVNKAFEHAINERPLRVGINLNLQQP